MALVQSQASEAEASGARSSSGRRRYTAAEVSAGRGGVAVGGASVAGCAPARDQRQSAVQLAPVGAARHSGCDGGITEGRGASLRAGGRGGRRRAGRPGRDRAAERRAAADRGRGRARSPGRGTGGGEGGLVIQVAAGTRVYLACRPVDAAAGFHCARRSHRPQCCSN